MRLNRTTLAGIIFLLSVMNSMAQLDHTKWKLVDLTGTTLKIPSGAVFTVGFEAGQYNISACNLISGGFRVEGQKLVATGPARSTMRACEPDRQAFDTALSSALNTNRSFEVGSDRLTLISEDGAKWVFQKELLASANAKTKFIYVSAFTKDCTGIMPMKCLQVRNSKEEPWRLHYTGIVGFKPVPGIEYRLRIKEDRVPRPAADASSIVWYLDMVVEQTVVDRQAAEAYEAAPKED